MPNRRVEGLSFIWCCLFIAALIICNDATAQGNPNSAKPRCTNFDYYFVDPAMVHVASSGGALSVRLLHWLGFDIDKKLACRQKESTMLHWAATEGNTDTMLVLLEKGADVGPTNTDKMTPLHWAAYFGHTDAARLLLENEADLTARNEYGFVPLHYAAVHNNLGTMGLLLDNGALIEARSHEGNTPLHLAVYAGYMDTTQALLNQDADIGAVASDGSTVLHYAAGSAYATSELVNALLAAGADANIMDNEGKLPLDLAMENDKLQGSKVVEILVRATKR